MCWLHVLSAIPHAMIEPAIRVALLVAAVAIALLLLWSYERQSFSVRASFVPGITVFTSAGCRLCPQTISALRNHGVHPLVVNVDTGSAPEIRSVPTVVVADASGAVVLRRVGLAALQDVALIVEASKQDATPQDAGASEVPRSHDSKSRP